MTENDKAKELIEKYWKFNQIYKLGTGKKDYRKAKIYALMCVDEILANIEATIFYHKDSIALPFNKDYWTKVRSEIESL